MKLPNFADFKEFKNLRKKMNAIKDGVFELFDETKHLSGEERRKLEKGIRLSSSQLKRMRDTTLRYKNTRVIIYAPTNPNFYHIAECEILAKIFKNSDSVHKKTNVDESTGLSASRFFENGLLVFTNLNEKYPNQVDLEKLNFKEDSAKKTIDEAKKLEKTNETSNLSASRFFERNHSLKICRHCLQKINYKGFDMYQNRKFSYSENLAENFTKAEFFKEYKIYPLTSDLL